MASLLMVDNARHRFRLLGLKLPTFRLLDRSHIWSYLTPYTFVINSNDVDASR